MKVADLTDVLFSDQLINIIDAEFNDLYYGINDKLDDVKHKDILNKEVLYVEPHRHYIAIRIKKGE